MRSRRGREGSVLENRTLEDVYAERFGAAAEAYNARQAELSDYEDVYLTLGESL